MADTCTAILQIISRNYFTISTENSNKYTLSKFNRDLFRWSFVGPPEWRQSLTFLAESAKTQNRAQTHHNDKYIKTVSWTTCLAKYITHNVYSGSLADKYTTQSVPNVKRRGLWVIQFFTRLLNSPGTLFKLFNKLIHEALEVNKPYLKP